MQEKRRYVRWSISKKVKYKLESSQEELECLSRDISLRGVQLLLDSKIELHTILELAIEIPDSSNLIFARAEVIWQKKFEEENKDVFQTGLYLVRFSDSDKEKLFNFIKENLRDELIRRWWTDIK